jgi:hypothetical protein
MYAYKSFFEIDILSSSSTSISKSTFCVPDSPLFLSLSFFCNAVQEARQMRQGRKDQIARPSLMSCRQAPSPGPHRFSPSLVPRKAQAQEYPQMPSLETAHGAGGERGEGGVRPLPPPSKLKTTSTPPLPKIGLDHLSGHRPGTSCRHIQTSPPLLGGPTSGRKFQTQAI